MEDETMKEIYLIAAYFPETGEERILRNAYTTKEYALEGVAEYNEMHKNGELYKDKKVIIYHTEVRLVK